MSAAPLPLNETDRLAALRSYAVLDTVNEEVFDDVVSLAARLTGSPIALVSLVDAERQWFKACYGIDATEAPREIAFCSHTILDPLHPLIIEDATADPRFKANPTVIGEPNIRAYLGVPLVDPDGYALGSLCVIDHVPRSYDRETIGAVRTLARAVTAHLELRRSLLRAREMAFTDPLTGLPNRRAVMAKLLETITRGCPLSVITADLDHFKEVNDGEGHAAGDLLLQVAADRLREAVRPGDMVGRIGGDEFVILLIGLSDRAIASEIAHRISATLPTSVPYGTRLLRLGATLGVAVVPGDADEPELVMRIADEALMRAKRDGRGSVGCASREDAKRLHRSAAIVRAFDADTDENDAIRSATVQFQPIVTLDYTASSGPGIIALEALARWTHPDVGEVPPGDLFPVIGPDRAARLGRAVREQALAAFASLQLDGLSGVRVALNLSASEVARMDIALRIAEQVERAGLSLRAVEIEITEEVLLDRVSDRTLDQLAALRGRGARLVLDDFGTGNSGLAQLLRLPLDGVKLDKQFIHRLGHDIRAEEIIRATVSLAHSLGLEVVAEGVETERQMAMLRALGCDAVQGFLLARPMTTEVLKTWLHRRILDSIPNLVSLKLKKAGEPG